MNQIETAICYFNDLLAENACLKKGKLFGKTELVEKGERTIPVVIENGFAKDVLPSEQNMPLIYWRVSDVVNADDPEGFGPETNNATAALTMYFYASTRILKQCNAAQLDWSGTIANILPKGLFQINSDIHSCSLSDLAIDTDKSGILASELAGNNIEGKVLDLIVFSITTTFTGSFCGPICG